MAWIKLETHTFDKVEIYTIAEKLSIDADSVVGKCCRIWAWFDANTTDGVTKSVTKALLDRQCGVTGFCNAMVDAGWMADDGENIMLPFYDRHNSATAKSRALGTKRQAKYKSNAIADASGNAVGNDIADDEASPKSSHREEKRRGEEKREEVKEKPRATRLPQDWQPSEEDIEYCKTKRPDLNWRDVVENFKGYWLAKPKDNTKLDWSLTWQGWVRKETAPRNAPTKQQFFNGLGEHGQRTAENAKQFMRDMGHDV